MPKKVVKSSSAKKTKAISTKKNHSTPEVEKILIENFVSLQKVMTNLSLKFDDLTKQLSKLLELFEISAKTLAEKEFEIEKKGSDKKVVEKIDNLLEQNKIIARGLTLIHEKIPEQQQEDDISSQNPLPSIQQQKPLPPIQQQRPQTRIEGYQKSISSNLPPEPPAPQFSNK
jgi:hypothetical protein